MNIDNPTLAHFRHFRHFSSLFTPSPLYICRGSSTNQLLFMQNKPNVKDAQINVNSLITKDYRKKDDFAVQKNKANSKPISKAKKYPKRFYNTVFAKTGSAFVDVLIIKQILTCLDIVNVVVGCYVPEESDHIFTGIRMIGAESDFAP